MVRFYSNKLNREIAIAVVSKMKPDEVKVFHEELKYVIESLTDTINEANERKKATGADVDSDWLHRVTTKRRIAMKFAHECSTVSQGGSTLDQQLVYERMYRSKFRALLVEEFGEEELAAIEREITEAATAEYKAWLQTNKQQMWYVPKLPRKS
jgi:hypothetical protein